MVTKEQVYEALQDCYDPEIPVNIVDLGLVYDVEVEDDAVAVKMTLTTAGMRDGRHDRLQRPVPDHGDPRRQGCQRGPGLGSALGTRAGSARKRGKKLGIG